jgi:hypothetical protein
MHLIEESEKQALMEPSIYTLIANKNKNETKTYVNY